MQIDLTGRTALITGGSMGLGRAMGMKMAAGWGEYRASCAAPGTT